MEYVLPVIGNAEKERERDREIDRHRPETRYCNSTLTTVAAKPQNFLTFLSTNLSDFVCHVCLHDFGHELTYGSEIVQIARNQNGTTLCDENEN